MIKSKLSKGMIVVILLVMLLPVFLVGTYDRPSADDYDYAIVTHRALIQEDASFFNVIKAAWETDMTFYHTWQGLYSSAFLLALQPGIFGEQYYALTVFIVLGIVFLALLGTFWFLLKRLTEDKKIGYAALLALMGTVVFAMGVPSPLQALYWYNGAMNYIPFLFAAIFLQALVFELYYLKGSKRYYVYLVLATLLSFVISGGNHVSSFLNIMLLFLTSVYLATKHRLYSIPLFVSAVLGFLIMYLAPGTAIRQQNFVQPTVVETIVQSIVHTMDTVVEWVDLPWLFTLLLFTPFALAIIQKKRTEKAFAYPLIPFIISLGIICGLYCVPFYAMGTFGPGRVTNVIWFTFLALSLFCYTYFLGWLFRKTGYSVEKAVDVMQNKGIHLILFLACAVVLFTFSQDETQKATGVKAVEALADGSVAGYAREMDARYVQYHDMSRDYVEVKTLTYQPELLFLFDIGVDTGIWPNTSLGYFYDKEIKLVY